MGFLSPFVRGQTCMWALPRVWRREADTTSCVADYLTRSVRRASGFVLADNPLGNPCAKGDNHSSVALGDHELISFQCHLDTLRYVEDTVFQSCRSSR